MVSFKLSDLDQTRLLGELVEAGDHAPIGGLTAGQIKAIGELLFRTLADHYITPTVEHYREQARAEAEEACKEAILQQDAELNALALELCVLRTKIDQLKGDA